MKKNKNKKEKRIPIILDEAVIYSILNKIISSAIRISDTKRIYKDLDIHCFNFLKKQIEPCLLTKYLPHETIIDSNYNSNEVNDFFFNASKISKKEIWININEPKPSKIDRSATRNILFKFIKSSNKSISKFSNKHLQDNNKYNYNILNNKEKNNDVKINDETLNIKIEENKNSDNINNNEIKEENDEYKDYKVIIRKKKKKHVSVSIYGVKYEKEEIDKIIEMPSFDIINENNENNFNKKDEFNKLRKEYIDLKLRKTNENNNLYIAKTRRGSKQINNAFLKMFDNSRLTFDPNGKIMHLHLPKLSQPTSEFNSPKLKISNNLINDNSKKNNRRPSIRLKRPTITSFEKHNFNNIKDINKEIIQKNENINENQININNNDNLMNENKKKNNNTEKIEYNPLDQKNLFSFNNFYRIRKKIIGGQNFNKIIPEVGVIISNDYKKEQKKFGGFKYMSKYNKPSLNELTKILENNGVFGSEDNSFLSFNSETNDVNNNNYNGYNEEFSENNNPLFQNAFSLDNKNRIFSSFSNNNKKRNLNNNFSINMDDSINKNDNIRYLKSSFIKSSPTKKIMGNSIDNIILSHNKKINDIYRILIDDDKNKVSNNEINKNLINKNNKSKNVISVKEFIDIKRKLPIINELNKGNEELQKGRNIISKFNLDIIQNKNWGNYYNLKNNEKDKNIFSNNFNIKDKYKKLKIIDENNNKNFIRERNNIKKKFFRSSSTGALIS